MKIKQLYLADFGKDYLVLVEKEDNFTEEDEIVVDYDEPATN